MPAPVLTHVAEDGATRQVFGVMAGNAAHSRGVK